jgi:hypothetical protein
MGLGPEGGGYAADEAHNEDMGPENCAGVTA